MNIPDELHYTETHEWIRFDGATAVVGITDHAQEELGEVTFVEVPEVGREVSAGDAVAVVESVKAASDIYSPVAGRIVEGNSGMASDPGAINSDPYGAGWLFRIECGTESDRSALKSAEQYRESLS